MNVLLGILILIALIQRGNLLECNTCKVQATEAGQDACNGIDSLRKCPLGNNVCLSAIFEANNGNVKTYTTMKSCFQKMNGEECDNFFKNQKNLYRDSIIIPNHCYACDTDNCNEKNIISSGNLRISCIYLILILGITLVSFL